MKGTGLKSITESRNQTNEFLEKDRVSKSFLESVKCRKLRCIRHFGHFMIKNNSLKRKTTSKKKKKKERRRRRRRRQNTSWIDNATSWTGLHLKDILRKTVDRCK